MQSVWRGAGRLLTRPCNQFCRAREARRWCSAQTVNTAQTNPQYSDENRTHFGYQTVGEEEKRDKVLDVFHKVADR